MSKKSIVKQFEDFKVKHSLTNRDVAKIAKEYANSDYDLASTHFSEKYNVSKSVFYKIRDYAVIFCLIDEDCCKRLKKKTLANYERNNPNGTITGPENHFSELYEKRQEFLDSFSENDIKDIAYKYAEGVSTENIAFLYDTGKYAIKVLLKKGIVLLIVDDITTQTIANRLGDSMKSILDMRKKNKANIVICLEKEIEVIDFKLTNYDLYFRNHNSEQKPTKEELQKQLKELVKREKELLR